MSVFGWRKMVVIVWCATTIATVLIFCIVNKAQITNEILLGLGLIAGLGGLHNYTQGKVDTAIGKTI